MTAVVAAWLRGMAAARKSLVVGVQGVHGSGKTHLCVELERDLGRDLRVAVLSLDDFSLPRTQLGDAVQGPPGTHDIELLATTIARVLHRSVCVPVFDKACMGGLGDRIGWRTLHGPVDIVLVEGWCVGFAPLPADCGEFVDVDGAFARMETLVHTLFDAMVVLRSSASAAFVWREAAEATVRTRTRGMRKDEVRSFVAHHIPYYDRYLDAFHRAADESPIPRLTLCLDSNAPRPRVERVDFFAPHFLPVSQSSV